MEKQRLAFYDKPDTKWVGPLSHRVLRIIGWAALAVGMMLSMSALLRTEQTSAYAFIVEPWNYILDCFSSISMPLFMLAAFGLVASRRKTFKADLMTFGIGSLAIFLGALFFELRYVFSLLNTLAEIPYQDINGFLIGKFGKSLQFNIFIDLFMVALFSFFMDYKPRTIFTGKKLIYFRLFAILPVLYIIASYVISIFVRTGSINIPVSLLALLATKHPVMIFVFFAAILFLKHRDLVMVRLGKTKEEIATYRNSNNRAKSFSTFIAIAYLIVAVLDIAISFTIFGLCPEGTDITKLITTYRLTEVANCIFAIPFVLLFSYKREVKKPQFDLFVNLGGIGVIAFVVIEGLYEFIMNINQYIS